MLATWLHDDTIRLQDRGKDWPQVLELCAKPLLDARIITPEYITAIIEQHCKLGPYYVLAPGLAMPHARPEEGAVGLGLSLLKLQHGVTFGSEDNDPVDLIIMLAAPDKHSHIDMIAALAELFSSDDEMQKMHQATTIEEIKDIISRF
ncbi:PTS sugar transporter subunit IIA [Aeromonas enteropelogenes]|uniref:PTS sugar transporter subunit IIA n=1 Tax=Aeromonas enteropelogenes TaxID=29489 RepID=UPI00191EA5FC|nr:PTS sugar transporter subunit IIA [Aeromonas enteropelogenes]MBL0521081.1 PTS sugar transporter subunit IIA [Aeromonas enteropelogenes]